MVSLKYLGGTLLVAFVLWWLMFSPLSAPGLGFWPLMSLSAFLLTALASLRASPSWWRRLHVSPLNVLLGVGLAVGLWLVFWGGDAVSATLFPFAPAQIHAIYEIKESLSPWALSCLLIFFIGPAEEIFWRGFVQEQFSLRFGPNAGLLIATALYALVHVASGNFMLIMAALVAGGMWGLCYRLWPQRFSAIVVSHALWDAAVFIWFPIR